MQISFCSQLYFVFDEHMDNRQTEKSMPDKWVDYIKKNIYKDFQVEWRPLINKINYINGNSKMAEIVLSLASKNAIWTSKAFW